MNASIARRWTALALLTSVATFCGATPAQAGLAVQYSTTGTFLDTSTNTYTDSWNIWGPIPGGSTTVTFNGVSSTTSPLSSGGSPIFANYGSFSVDTSLLGGPELSTAFRLTISMLDPSSPDSPQDFGTATLEGLIGVSETGYLTLEFTNPTSLAFGFSNHDIGGLLHNGTVTFTIDTPQAFLFAGGHSLGLLDGDISAEFHPVPEPSTVAMALSALVPLGVVGVRRSRRKQAAN